MRPRLLGRALLGLILAAPEARADVLITDPAPSGPPAIVAPPPESTILLYGAAPPVPAAESALPPPPDAAAHARAAWRRAERLRRFKERRGHE